MMTPVLCVALLLPLAPQNAEPAPDRFKELEAACAELKARLSAAGRRIAELEEAQSALEETARNAKELKEASKRKVTGLESALSALSKRIAELERAAGQAAELRRKGETLTERVGKAEGRTTVLQKKVQTLEERLEKAEEASDVRREIRGLKQALLLSRYACEDGDAVGKDTYPHEDHFADLGIGYQYPGEKEPGLLVVGIISGRPAEQAGLKAGDFLLKVDGEPVNKSGLPESREVNGEWIRRTVPPGYVTTHLPGDAVTLEVLRGEETLKVKASFDCRVCLKDCPFAAPER